MELDTSINSLTGDISACPHSWENSGPNQSRLGKASLVSSLKNIGDFNLFLEDSLGSGQNLSNLPLEPTERENITWELADNPGEKSSSIKSLQLDDCSDGESELEEEIIRVKTRHNAKKIVSDDEGDSVIEGMLSPLPNPLLIQFSSSPKSNRSQLELFFSEMCSGGNNSAISRRSLASRRSLINVILDHVEDMEEDACEPKSTNEYLEEAASVAESSQESEHSEEEATEETSLFQREVCSLPAPHADSTPCASNKDSQETPEHNPSSAAEATDEYETLVRYGKELKESGKIQGALSCLLKALDIQSTDPQVMLMALSLYKLLNQM
uniref:Uncharacterized protein n=2 Tax=Monodelphis domestica TaxID=13616 RepID=F7AXD3_MONDO